MATFNAPLQVKFNFILQTRPIGIAAKGAIQSICKSSAQLTGPSIRRISSAESAISVHVLSSRGVPI